MKEVERIVQTRNTAEFIAAQSMTVRFHRTLMEPNRRGGIQQSAGFWTKLQTVRFVEAKQRKRRSGLSETTAGRMERKHDIVIAMPDADIKAGDEFDREDVVWKVTRTTPKPYELIAEVDIKGSADG